MKKLTERKKFQNSLILNCCYSSNPSVNGDMELGVLFLKSKIQIWMWTEEYAESIAEFPVKTPWREVVDYALNDETFVSAVHLNDISIQNDIPPIGQFLGLAITESEQDKVRARLLLKLSDHELSELHRFQHKKLYDVGLMRILDNLAEELQANDAEIEALEAPKLSEVFNLYDLEKAFKLSLQNLLKHLEEQENRRAREDAELDCFEERIKEFITSWASKRPSRRYPGGGSLPASGQLELNRYIRKYILENKKFPTGVHLIPKGLDIFDRYSEEFEVNFDAF